MHLCLLASSFHSTARVKKQMEWQQRQPRIRNKNESPVLDYRIDVSYPPPSITSPNTRVPSRVKTDTPSLRLPPVVVHFFSPSQVVTTSIAVIPYLNTVDCPFDRGPWFVTSGSHPFLFLFFYRRGSWWKLECDWGFLFCSKLRCGNGWRPKGNEQKLPLRHHFSFFIWWKEEKKYVNELCALGVCTHVRRWTKMIGESRFPIHSESKKLVTFCLEVL